MTPDTEPNTTQWAAFVAFLLLLLVPLAVALAAWFKHRYARAVVRLQSSTAVSDPHRTADTQPTAEITTTMVVRQLALKVLEADEVHDLTPGQDPTQPARRLRRRILAVQFVSGLLYWWSLLLVMGVALTYLLQVTGQDQEGSAPLADGVVHLVLWPLLVLPAALAWAFQAGVRESRVWMSAGATMALFGAGLALSGIGWLASGVFALVCALLGFMLAAFMRPAVRGAGPPLVAAFTVGLLVFCGLVALVVVFDTSAEEDPVTTSDWAMATGAMLLMLLVAALASWRMLLRLARRYTAKRFSELQLALGAYWALVTAFTLAIVLLLSFEERTASSMEWLGLVILLLWLLWRWLQRAALWLALRRPPPPLGALLLLRVFKPSERSETFTDRFLARWRFAGPVWMIAGPDLAGAFMEPDEFFAYLGRRLHQRFISDPGKLPERVAAMDNARDPDGRFRVNELFCANNTWQPAVLSLIDRAGVVLLDLREYTHQRAGTRFELEALLQRAPLHKVLVVVGADERLDDICDEIASIWQTVADRAPATTGVPALQLVRLTEGSDAEMLGLFRVAATAAMHSSLTEEQAPIPPR